MTSNARESKRLPHAFRLHTCSNVERMGAGSARVTTSGRCTSRAATTCATAALCLCVSVRACVRVRVRACLLALKHCILTSSVPGREQDAIALWCSGQQLPEFNRCGIVSTDSDRSELVNHYGMPASAMPQKMGMYTPQWGKIPNIPGLTQGGNTSAVIVYPSNSRLGEKFPFLSFAHGTFVGGRIPPTEVTYKPVLELVVSYGFIVVAPDTCTEKACYSRFSADQVATISACRANTSLHPGLAHASFEKVGVFGHSMGGMSTLACAGGSSLGIKPADYGIAAAVSMHTCQDYLLDGGGNVSVPILFTAGDADKICADGCAKKFYDSVTYARKAFLDIADADHHDPTNMGQNREDKAVALYLSCHLKNEECDQVYGPSGKALCDQVQGGFPSTCEMKGAAP
jgi:dienelactone hydrolase